eukprot:gene46375-19253_t
MILRSTGEMVSLGPVGTSTQQAAMRKYWGIGSPLRDPKPPPTVKESDVAQLLAVNRVLDGDCDVAELN